MLKKGLVSFFMIIIIFMGFVSPKMVMGASSRQMESLDRGVVAVKNSSGVFVSWRVLGNETSNVTYNLYRDSTKVANVTGASNYIDTAGTTGSKYSVSAVVNGVEKAKSAAISIWGSNYLQVPLQIPAGGTTPDGVAYTYNANDCSVGDLDGDGQYEIVLKWDPSNSKDNSQKGYTGNVYLDAYEMNGTRLWRIDLGKNIRAGAHYTQFMVYDLNGDGKAEVACKTADGTKDGIGTVIGSSSADYRNSSGYILSGPEYLTLFEGSTGKALNTANYEPGRGTVSSWGDSYGNRVDRFLGCIAYLDGVHPSLVMTRGYYTRAVIVAYDWNGSTLTKRWSFDSSSSGNSGYAGQGNHNLSVADVDSDGKDEIVYGSATIDDNGKGLYTTGLRHGDAAHVGDLDPNRPGLEVWSSHEDSSGNGGIGASFRDAKTGSVLWSFKSTADVGRACSADLTAKYPGEEVWAAGTPLYSTTGQDIGARTVPINFAIWWDGDELRELLDNISISKYGGGTLLSATGCASNNTTKATPCLQADILGDWREEVVLRTSDNKYLNIYTTTNMTSRRIYTLMHDPVYRMGIAWQNVAYNQPPHTGFFLGDGMATPPVPAIYLAGASTGTPVEEPIKGAVIEDGTVFMLKNKKSNLYMDVAGGAAANSTNVQQWGATGPGAYNTWKAVSAGDGYYRIYSQLSDGKTYLLDVTAGKTVNGTNVEIYSNSSSNAQLFKFVDNSDGTYTIVTKVSQDKSCVEVANASMSNGGNVQEWQLNGDDCQKWIMEKVQAQVPPEIVLYGDINGDAKVNVFDYVMLKKYISGAITELPVVGGLTGADVNRDGKANVFDYIMLKRYLSGAITEFPA